MILLALTGQQNYTDKLKIIEMEKIIEPSHSKLGWSKVLISHNTTVINTNRRSAILA